MKSLLKNAREQKGFKTRELAQLADIDQALISKFESGTRKPTKDQISKLAQLLEIDYETLMVAWLKEKILYEIGDEEFALKAILLAEQEIQNNKKKINSAILSSFQSILDEIEVYKSQIQSLNHFELRKISKTLESEFIFKSIRLSANSLTLEETKSVINEGLTISGKSMQEHMEAINFHETLIYLKDLVQKKINVNEKELLVFHNLILRGNTKSENQEKYKNDPLVIRKMNLFFNWFETNKNSLHPIILASECYLKLLEINPFEKGNLQIANLILNWILSLHNYLFTTVEENDQNRDDKSVFTNYILQTQKVNLIRAIGLVSK
ncbi:helix-turn-helix domain-containing protein [Flavobacterium sp. HTF]|uniref:helix-turn-helix domain-containing protein n=1 Tax=Flavobacterium sp. HTF TaxID=2170732 RepID=UPI000D5E4174|nr:helix-turn-helix domain-containing protein [Flavobacterium sp. HTF]PWB21586.1 DNA-binding protein [Flavobacterium sp. HTF]